MFCYVILGVGIQPQVQPLNETCALNKCAGGGSTELTQPSPLVLESLDCEMTVG